MSRQHTRAANAVGRRKMRRGWDAFREGPDPRGADGATKCFHNNQYIVLYVPPMDTALGPVERLMIRRGDSSTDVPWAHKQRIKDELLGEDRVAVEWFPSRDKLVDNHNWYHLWVFEPGFVMPFGLV